MEFQEGENIILDLREVIIYDFDYLDEYYKLIREMGNTKEFYLIGIDRKWIEDIKIWNSEWLEEFYLNQRILFPN